MMAADFWSPTGRNRNRSMGFYVRKSVSVGPFRFNFSSSGVGVSAGVKGFRVGTGPRGNYISVGRGGLYYRATFPAGTSRTMRTNPPAQPVPVPQVDNRPSQATPGVGPMVAIESADVSEMQDSSSTELLNELNGKANRPNYWKWTAAASIILLWIIAKTESPTALIIGFIVLAGLTIYVGIRDALAKTAVLCYQLDGPNEQSFEKLHSAFSDVSKCHKIWRIDSTGKVHDRKYHAGAGALITRKEISFGKGLPPNVKSNLEVPLVRAGAISLYFMPDRILVYSASGVGAVSYKDLQFYGEHQCFIETDSVPRDAEVVDHTWRYVNKNGGPDKRFKDNRKLPVALYEELHFRSSSGLNEVFQTSRHSVSEGLRSALRSMVNVLPA